MPKPEDYTKIPAHEKSISKARKTKEGLDLTWNQFLERAATELKQ